MTKLLNKTKNEEHIEMEPQKIKMVKLHGDMLIRRLLDFYKNELVVRIIINMLKDTGYDNRDGLIITYVKSENKYLIVTANDKYDALVKTRKGVALA